MAIGHDNNSLGSDTLPLFTKDTTNIKQWQEAERDRIASLGNECNLDPAYNGARVLITAKKNNLILNTGAAKINSPYIPVVAQTVQKANPNQWFRLEKVNPSKADSSWYIRCDRDQSGNADNRFSMYLVGTNGYVYLHPSVNGPSAQWVISWEAGYYRIKNVENYPYSKYLDCWKGFANWAEICNRNDTTEGRENQYWQIERVAQASAGSLALPSKPVHLSRAYHGSRVTITNLSGGFSLDLGGGATTGQGPAYMRNNNVANTDLLSAWQVITLNQINNTEDSEWKLRITVNQLPWYLSSEPTNNAMPIRINDGDVGREGVFWYIIHVGGAGSPVKIQNKRTKLFLEYIEGSVEFNLKTTQDDQGAGLNQLFAIVKVPPLKGEP